MIEMKRINASDAAEKKAFFEMLDKRSGETNAKVTAACLSTMRFLVM